VSATATVERVSLPHGLTYFAHQRECVQAFHDGARRMIWRHHRQSGKGLGAIGFVSMAAFERPGTYAVVSPTHGLSRENYWDARDPDAGTRYLDVIPPQLVVDSNENEMALVMATKTAGKTSRIVFRSADDPDRLRGPAYAGVVLDEFATMPSAEPLDVVRIPLERAKGWLLITSTPKGLNHFHDVWKNAESAGGWYLSKKTILDPRRHDGEPIISMAAIDQERAEGQREEWIQQEYFVEFTAALIGSYYGDQITRAEQEGRIGDYPHRPDLPVLVAFDLGVRDLTVATYLQVVGEWYHVIDCDAFEGLALPEILSRVRAKGYNIDRRGWYAPHDLAQRDFTAADTAGQAMSRVDVARKLGVPFQVVPRVANIQDAIDAVRRLFPRLRFDRRKCSRLLEALGAYMRLYDPKTKAFAPKPAHTWASHYADALACFARGHREPRTAPYQKPKVLGVGWLKDRWPNA
jgi:phage terminase large subunit